MHTIMSELHQDHVNMARLLDMMDQQLQLMKTDGEPDLLLLLDITDYMRRYSDQIHHPREDEVYKVLSARTQEGADMVEHLLDEHARLPGITIDFYGLLDGVINGGAIISQQELVSKIQEFIDIERDHINKEEGSLFPIINKTLQEADWVVVEQGNFDVLDPLFGEHVVEHYRKLYQAVTNAAS